MSSAAFPHLFSPFSIGGLTFKNRIFSTGHDTMLAEHGRIGDALVAYHAARAEGGAGLIVVQVAAIHDSARYTAHMLDVLLEEVRAPLVLGESPGAVEETIEYVWFNGRPVLMVVDRQSLGETLKYVLATDHLGTPMRAYDLGGNVVWAADYEVFGRAYEYVPGSSVAPSVRVNLRFPGQYFDEETGLHYNWWRYYEPGTGRYITPDPVGVLIPPLAILKSTGLLSGLLATGRKLGFPDRGFDGPNDIYAYATNRPLNITDRSGLYPDSGTCHDHIQLYAGSTSCQGDTCTSEFPHSADHSVKGGCQPKEGGSILNCTFCLGICGG